MRLMSNNQWKCDGNCDAWRADGLDCSAPARVKGLLRAYEAILPDAMGLQEVSQLMAHLMMDRLGSLTLSDGTPVRYEYISGGDTPIVYRRDRLKLLESGFFLYDEAVPGLEGAFNNNESKSYAWAAFEDRSDGKRFALDRLLAIMLRSSDGNAADSLMDFVARRSINTFCPLDGFESVKVNYHLSKAENGTLQDNFISAADVCRIVETQYNSDGPFGRDFLLLNLTAEDKDTCHGLGRHLIDEADVVMNFYAVVTRLYNEVLIIEDGETAYAVAFMGDSERHVVLEDLASRIGDYVYETLCED